MLTTPTESDGHELLAKRQRYRRLFYASIAVAVGGFLAGIYLGYPLVGVTVYWAGILAMLGVWKGTALQLFDEREIALEERASRDSLNLLAFPLILVVPALSVLQEIGYFEITPRLSGMIWGMLTPYVVFGVVYAVYRYRS